MDILLFGGSRERLSAARIEALEQAAAPLEVVITNDVDTVRRYLPDVVVAASQVPTDILVDAPRLRWVQRWTAGVEDIVSSPQLSEQGVTVTSVSGIHGEPIAEHVFAMLLCLAREMQLSIRRQATREWPPQSSHRLWEIRGKSMLIVGLGAIGSRIAEIATAFDMSITGIRRSADRVEEFPVVPLSELHRVLGAADVVVCALPLTDATRGVFDAQAFAAMKPGAVFINIARGGHVDQPALVAALQSGHLGAAGLDVTDPEPLPADSPLWDMENVIITPHMSGLTPAYGARAWTIFLENLRRFHLGVPLHNVVDFALGY